MTYMILTALIGLLIIYMYYLGKKNTHTVEVITFPFDMRERKIFFISDIHRRRIDHGWIKQFPSVDYVIIGGDLVEEGTDDNVLKENLYILQTMGSVLFVWGNNDFKFGEEKLRKILLESNVKILENESLTLDSDEKPWRIVGVKEVEVNPGDDRVWEVDDVFQNELVYSLVISHYPETVYAISEHSKVIALLCGHTHGGQIRIGPIGIAERGGWKRKHNISVFISNGYGTRKLPLRFGAEPQVHLIYLRGKV